MNEEERLVVRKDGCELLWAKNVSLVGLAGREPWFDGLGGSGGFGRCGDSSCVTTCNAGMSASLGGDCGYADLTVGAM